MVFLLKLFIFSTFLISSFGNSKPEVEVDYQLKQSEVISQGLRDFNTPFFGNQKSIHFAVYLKDTNDQIVGGIIAWMRPGIQLLCIDAIWLSETWRHKGYGKQLMLTAEAEGKKHGCKHAQVDTLSFQAEQFYKKLGYKRVGVVKKLYGDHDLYFLRKDL